MSTTILRSQTLVMSLTIGSSLGFPLILGGGSAQCAGLSTLLVRGVDYLLTRKDLIAGRGLCLVSLVESISPRAVRGF